MDASCSRLSKGSLNFDRGDPLKNTLSPYQFKTTQSA